MYDVNNTVAMCHVRIASKTGLLFLIVLFRYIHLILAVKITATPKAPVVGEKCTIKCQSNSGFNGQLKIIATVDTGVKLERQITYNVSGNKVFSLSRDEPEHTWKSINELEFSKDPSEVSVSVTFTVDENDRIDIQCIAISSDRSSIDQKFLKQLDVQSKPKILELHFKNDKNVKINDSSEGDNITAKCQLRMGIPESSDFNLTTPRSVGPPLSSPDLKTKIGYTLKTLERNLQVRLKDHNNKIWCMASNKYGQDRQSLTMLVKHAVSIVTLESKKVYVGSHIKCKADGHPAPNLKIEFTEGNPAWYQVGQSHHIIAPGIAAVNISSNADSGFYDVTCTATGTFNGTNVTIATNGTIEILPLELHRKNWVRIGVGIGLSILFVLFAIGAAAYVRLPRADDSVKAAAN